MIYFAQDAEGGPVEIGTSFDVPARIRQSEARYGRPSALLATLPGERAEGRAEIFRFRRDLGLRETPRYAMIT